MTYGEIKEYIKNNQDLKYRDFHCRLSPDIPDITGVRVPVIKELAKKIVSDGADNFLKQCTFSSYEERLLYGIVIGSLKTDFNSVAKLIRLFIPQINSWGVCDTFCASLKITKKHMPEMLGIIKTELSSDKTYSKRFAVVMLLDYYITDQYTNEVLSLYDSVKSDEYYVNMAIAWGISVCFIKQRDKTVSYMHQNTLNRFTVNKAVQKIRESLRVTTEDREFVKLFIRP